jgi:hypothetical protein
MKKFLATASMNFLATMFRIVGLFPILNHSLISLLDSFVLSLNMSTKTKTKIPKKIKTLRKRGGRHPRPEFAEDVPPQRRLTAVDIMDINYDDDDDYDDDEFSVFDLSDFGQETRLQESEPQETQPKYDDYIGDILSIGGGICLEYDVGGWNNPADYDNDSDFVSDVESDGDYRLDSDGDYRLPSRRSIHQSKQHPLHVHSDVDSDDSDGDYRLPSRRSIHQSKQHPLHVHSDACYKILLTCGHGGHGYDGQNVFNANGIRIGMCLT